MRYSAQGHPTHGANNSFRDGARMKYSPATRSIGALMVGAGVMAVAEYAGMPRLRSSGVFLLVVVGLYLIAGMSLTRWSKEE